MSAQLAIGCACIALGYKLFALGVSQLGQWMLLTRKPQAWIGAGSTLGNAVGIVIHNCPCKQVRWIAAWWIVTRMAGEELPKLALGQFVSTTMGTSFLAKLLKPAVSLIVGIALPRPTFVRALHINRKP